MGAGFVLSPSAASHFRKDAMNATAIKPYISGRDMTSRLRGVSMIDLYGWDIDRVRRETPQLYQHLLSTVKPVRDRDRRESYRNRWWIFAEPRSEFRAAREDCSRYIATSQTAKHRVFQFLDQSWLPDQTLVLIASEDAYHLGILSSRVHVNWTLAAGGTLEDRPRYSNSRCFDPFPFPDANAIQKQTIRVIAEELDAHRKRVLDEHPHLTLTGIYNVLEKVRAGTSPSPRLSRGEGEGPVLSQLPPPQPSPASGRGSAQQSPLAFTDNEQRIFDDGLVLILKELHDRLDAAVAAAYDWPADLADDQILGRLVALNKKRAEEEKRGLVRWLRPDYQIPRFAKGVDRQAAAEDGAQVAADLVGTLAQKPAFPASAVEQTAAVFTALYSVSGSTDAKQLADQFRKPKTTEKKIAAVLASLARLGYVTSPDGRTFALRRVA